MNAVFRPPSESHLDEPSARSRAETHGRPVAAGSGQPSSAGDVLCRCLQRWPWALASFLLFAVPACFLNLGGFGIISMDGMVIDGGRYMMERGDWAVPHVYGEPYTFKPALAYWLSAAVQEGLEDPSELALRLPFAFSGLLLGLGLLVLVGSRLGPRAGLLCAIAALGTPLFLEKVRLGEFDTPLAAGVGIAVAGASLALTARRDSGGLWLLTYAALAVAFLTKGALALMAYAPGLVAAAVACRALPRLWGSRHLAGTAAFVVPVGAYLAWAVWAGGLEVFSQPAGEAGIRGFGWSSEALLRLPLKPWMILGAFLPGSWMLAALPRLWKRLPPDHRALVRAGVAFLGAGIVTFCAVPTHEMRYYLPLLGGCALAAGVVMDAVAEPRSSGWLAPSSSGWQAPRFLGVGLRILAVLASLGAAAAAFERSSPTVFAGVCVAALALQGVVWGRSLRSGNAILGAAAAVSFFLILGYAWVVLPGRAAVRDLRAVAEAFEPHLYPGEPLWVEGPADLAGKHSSLYFYLGRPVKTLAPGQEPPMDSSLLVINGKPVVSSWRLEHLAQVDHPKFTYGLARVAAPRASGDPASR